MSLRLSSLSVAHRHIKAGLVIALITTLGACGSNPEKNRSYSQVKPNKVQQLSPQQLLEKAEQAYGSDKQRYWLLAADALLQQSQPEWAQSTLSNIDPDKLDTLQFIHYSLTAAIAATDNGSYFLAQELLAAPRLKQLFEQANLKQKQQLSELSASTYTLLGDTKAASEARINRSRWLSEEERQNNNQALWQGLMMESASTLETLAQGNTLLELKGWYELALIAKQDGAGIEQQQALVEQWRLQRPFHPAAISLPQDLQLLNQIIAEQARRVAIILPTTGRLGKAGQAIRDGFMVSLFQAQQQGSYIPEVDFYNSEQADIQQIYDQAVSAGAEFIIGPLDKSKVAKLNQRPSLPVPVLALNYIVAPSQSQEANYNPGLYQFGLATEDEARHAAQRAWLEGHKRAMILTPQSDWGNRGAAAFRKEWQQLGGVIVEEQQFTGNNDYSKVIENSLQLNQSTYRHRKLQQILATNLEFEPRRRQDIDAIFLLANSNQARQVKPTLAFHYAAYLPVYATSHIYNGQQDKKANRDLDNIRFSALPWLLKQDTDLQQQVKQFAKPAAAYQRLFALGADSFKIYPRIRQLSQVNSARIQGGTGSLNMLSNGQVVRQQQWATISNGVAKPLPAISQLHEQKNGQQ